MKTDNRELLARRHPEWEEFSLHWQWLQDSYEGGKTYRDATYGTDAQGLPIRNLARHKHEYPNPYDLQPGTPGVEGYTQANITTLIGLGQLAPATRPQRDAVFNSYDMRLTRTPVPNFLREAVDEHLHQIYAREITRKAPLAVKNWWKDVDGCGTTIDDFMRHIVAPLLMTLGQVDLLFDHPAAPDGEEVVTRADEVRLGLDGCVASLILPENLLWWRTDMRGRYIECLVREMHEDEGGCPEEHFRHWTAEGWSLYDDEGELEAAGTHNFGRVPIVRVFDRKRQRCRNTGQSRYEAIAEAQREYYNRDSELVLSDSLQVHPLLQGPEDIARPDGSVPIGPEWMLMMKRCETASNVTYAGYQYIDPPKGAAESLRTNKADIRSEVDRSARLARPAGDVNAPKGTVEQSGISKQLDAKSSHEMLAEISSTLRRCELTMAQMAQLVLSDGASDGLLSRVQVNYPSSFDLYTASDVAVTISDMQLILEKTGLLPEVEGPALQRYVRLAMPDRSDEFYDDADRAIDAFLAEGGGRAVAIKQAQETMMARAATMPPPEGKLTPAGKVRNQPNDPTQRLQPPGQTGKRNVDNPSDGKPKPTK